MKTDGRKHLIAVDPGLKTGYMEYELEDPLPRMVLSEELTINEFYDRIKSLFSTKEVVDNLQIVCEDFIITTETAKKTIGGNWSIELIGALKYLCYIHGVPITMQRPGDRMSISHDQLKTLGYWHVGGDGHANQASRHAVVYMLDELKNKNIAKALIQA